MRKSNKILGILALGAIALSFSLTARAADLRFMARSAGRQRVLTVSATDAVRNLYAAGPQVNVDASPAKDAVVAGGVVTINGNTADDLTAVGGNVTASGNVGGSARLAGGTVVVQGAIGEDLAVAGGNVYVSDKAAINGDVLFGGGAISIDAPVHGSLKLSSTAAYINSTIDGNVEFRGKNLQLGPSANIRGSLTYFSPEPYDRDANAQVAGAINYNQTQPRNFGRGFAGFLALGFFIKLISLILAGLLLVWVLRRRYEALTVETRHSFWKNAGYGLIFTIVTPIIALILLFTFVGIYIALMLMALYALVLLFAWIVGATSFGLWALKAMNRGKMPAFRYGSVALAVLISTVLAGIPILGLIFGIVLTLAGVGSIVRHAREASK